MMRFISLLLLPLSVLAAGDDSLAMLQLSQVSKSIASAAPEPEPEPEEWIPATGDGIIFGKGKGCEKCNDVGRPIKTAEGC